MKYLLPLLVILTACTPRPAVTTSQETVTPQSDSQLVVINLNQLSDTFMFKKATYTLDGEEIQVLSASDDDTILPPSSQIANTSINSGIHLLGVELSYRGNGFGVFEYLDGYTFRVNSTYHFEVPEGHSIKIVVVAYERCVELICERPQIRFEVDQLAVKNTR